MAINYPYIRNFDDALNLSEVQKSALSLMTDEQCEEYLNAWRDKEAYAQYTARDDLPQIVRRLLGLEIVDEDMVLTNGEIKRIRFKFPDDSINIPPPDAPDDSAWFMFSESEKIVYEWLSPAENDEYADACASYEDMKAYLERDDIPEFVRLVLTLDGWS